MLYLTKAIPKLEYTPTDAKMLARIQRKSVALYQSRSITYDQVTCEDLLQCLKASQPAWKKTSSWWIILHFCLFNFKTLPLSFVYYWYSSPFPSFQELSLFTVTLKILRLLYVFRLLTLCTKTSTSFRNPLFP